VEAAASIELHPKLLWFNVAPGSVPDGHLAAYPNGFFSHLVAGETVLTDGASTYVGAPHCVAPPHRGMLAFIPELDKVELSLQRNVERVNKMLEDWKFLAGPVRMSPAAPDFWSKASIATAAICKLLSVDQLLNVGVYY
jgi:hypothetical protein